jgi:hypothetical protein
VTPKEEEIEVPEVYPQLPHIEKKWTLPITPRPRPIQRQPDGSVTALGRRKRAVARVRTLCHDISINPVPIFLFFFWDHY